MQISAVEHINHPGTIYPAIRFKFQSTSCSYASRLSKLRFQCSTVQDSGMHTVSMRA